MAPFDHNGMGVVDYKFCAKWCFYRTIAWIGMAFLIGAELQLQRARYAVDARLPILGMLKVDAFEKCELRISDITQQTLNKYLFRIWRYLSANIRASNKQVGTLRFLVTWLGCRVGTAESATKISNVWRHQVALTPARRLPQYLLPFAELLRLHAFLGLLLPFQQNNCSSLNIL